MKKGEIQPEKLERVIAFYPHLSKWLGSINNAIFYQQIFYWSDKGVRDDGFIYKTKEEIEEETALTVKMQKKCVEDLEELGWLETKLIKVANAPTKHYKPIFPLKLPIVPKGQNRIVQKGRLEYDKRADSLLTEITTETTTENTTLATTVAPVISRPSVVPVRKDEHIIKIMDAFKETGLNPIQSYGNKTQRKACDQLVSAYGLDGTLKLVAGASEARKANDGGDRFAPLIKNPYDLASKAPSLISWGKKNKPASATISQTQKMIKNNLDKYGK